MSIKQMLSDTKIMISNNFLTMVLYTFVYLIVSIGCFYMVTLTRSIPILTFILALVYTIVLIPISAAYLISFLKLFRGEEPGPKEMFVCGFKMFGKLWKSTLFLLLIVLIPLAVSICGFYLVGQVTAKQAAGVPDQELGGLALGGLVLLLAGLIGIIIILLKYTLIYFVQYDHPDMKIKNVFKNSKKLMYGSKMNFFFIILVVQLVLFIIEQLTGRFIANAMVFNVINSLVNIILTPFLAALTVTIYEEKKSEVEE